MKRKISFLLALVMILTTLTILTAVPAAADEAEPAAPVAIGYQTTLAYDDEGNLVRNLRFVAMGWNADQYKEVGFTITCEEKGKSWGKSSTKVYGSLTGQTSDGKTMETYDASDYGADYLFALTILGAPTGANTFSVTPYAIKLDGTEVYGATGTASVTVSNVALTFGASGNALENVNRDGYGNAKWESGEEAYRLAKTGSVFDGMSYYFTPGFKNGSAITSDYRFVRVFCSVKSKSNATLKITSTGGGGGSVALTTTDTDGYVLSPTVELTAAVAGRYSSGTKNGIGFTVDGTYKVKGVYFFTSSEDAKAFSMEKINADNSGMITLSFDQNSGNAAVSVAGDIGNAAYDDLCDAYYVKTSSTSLEGMSRYVSANFDTACAITSDHKYVRVLYSGVRSDPQVGNTTLQIVNNGNGNKVTVSCTGTTYGFVLSDTITLSDSLVTRYINGSGYGISVGFTNQGSYWIKAVYFFTSKAEADAFEQTATHNVLGITFGDSGTGKYNTDDASNSYDSASNSVTFTTNLRAQFEHAYGTTLNHKYIRILYSSTSSGNQTLTYWNTANGNEKVTFTCAGTGGAFALTETAELSGGLLTRVATGGKTCCTMTGGDTYRIKAIYFFTSEEEANAFTLN